MGAGESVPRRTEFARRELLHPAHFVEELKEKAVQAGVVVEALLDHAHQTREGALLAHELVCGPVLPAVVQEEDHHQMQDCRVIFLQETLDELSPDVGVIAAEEIRGEEGEGASSEAVFSLDVGLLNSQEKSGVERVREGEITSVGGDEGQPCPQRVIDTVVGPAGRGDGVVEFLVGSAKA